MDLYSKIVPFPPRPTSYIPFKKSSSSVSWKSFTSTRCSPLANPTPHPFSSHLEPMANPTSPPFGLPHLPPCNPWVHQWQGPSWAVVCGKAYVPAGTLQEALDYACGEGGAECGAIKPKGACFFPDTVVAHASYAFNSYWLKTKRHGGTCKRLCPQL